MERQVLEDLQKVLAKAHSEQLSITTVRGLERARKRGQVLGRPKNNSERHGRVNNFRRNQ